MLRVRVMSNYMNFIICLFIFQMSFFSFADEVLYFYDSAIHPPTPFFSATSFDVSKSSKIEAEINKRLIFNDAPFLTEQQRVEKARSIINGDPKLKSLIKELSQSYKYLEKVFEFQIKKVPAIVLKENGRNWIVYGQTNVQKALVLIRNSDKYRSVSSLK